MGRLIGLAVDLGIDQISVQVVKVRCLKVRVDGASTRVVGVGADWRESADAKDRHKFDAGWGNGSPRRSYRRDCGFDFRPCK